MGLRSVFIPILNKEDLTAVLLMEQALNDTAEYECVNGIHYFCLIEGYLFAAWSHDGDTAFEFFKYFSPRLTRYTRIERLPPWIKPTPIYSNTVEDILENIMMSG
jgi:hypothetical protein